MLFSLCGEDKVQLKFTCVSSCNAACSEFSLILLCLSVGQQLEKRRKEKKTILLADTDITFSFDDPREDSLIKSQNVDVLDCCHYKTRTSEEKKKHKTITVHLETLSENYLVTDTVQCSPRSVCGASLLCWTRGENQGRDRRLYRVGEKGFLWCESVEIPQKQCPCYWSVLEWDTKTLQDVFLQRWAEWGTQLFPWMERLFLVLLAEFWGFWYNLELVAWLSGAGGQCYLRQAYALMFLMT